MAIAILNVGLTAAIEWGRPLAGTVLFVELRKAFVGNRPRTSAQLTIVGRSAFQQHVAVLQEIVTRAGVSVLPEG